MKRFRTLVRKPAALLAAGALALGAGVGAGLSLPSMSDAVEGGAGTGSASGPAGGGVTPGTTIRAAYLDNGIDSFRPGAIDLDTWIEATTGITRATDNQGRMFSCAEQALADADANAYTLGRARGSSDAEIARLIQEYPSRMVAVMWGDVPGMVSPNAIGFYSGWADVPGQAEAQAWNAFKGINDGSYWQSLQNGVPTTDYINGGAYSATYTEADYNTSLAGSGKNGTMGTVLTNMWNSMWAAGQSPAAVCLAFNVFMPEKGTPPKTVPAKSPSVNKYWGDETQAKTIADVDHTNNVGEDNWVFSPGDTVWTGVMARIPAQTGQYNKFVIVDNWEETAGIVDLDPSTAKVYYGYEDVTGEFTINSNGTTVTAVANSAFLERTNQPENDMDIRLVLKGTAKKVGKAGDLSTAKNKAAIDWDADSKEDGAETHIPANQPVVHVTWNQPNKVWTYDHAQSKTANDPDWTNQVAADDDWVMPGQKIATVVNYPIPAKLNLGYSGFEIADKLDGSAKYVNWASPDVKVFFGDTDVTGEFTITTSANKVTAVAKDAFLNRTKNLENQTLVKLSIEGTVNTTGFKAKEVYEMPNDGYVVVNGGSEQPTNTPIIKLKIPDDPIKVWSVNATVAQSTDDAKRTNAVDLDTRKVLPGDTVYGVVKGEVMSAVKQEVTQFSITDDWTDAAEWITFTEKGAKVYYDGKDVTSSFTITTSGTKTTATAKKAFLATLKDLSKDTDIRLVVEGKVRNAKAAEEGTTSTIENTGSVNYNGYTAQANKPPIKVVVPKPDKAWAKTEKAAMDLTDQKWTNKVGIDGRTLAPGDTTFVAVNGYIPADVTYDVQEFSIYDDWSDTKDWITFKAADAKVFKDGKDVSSSFTISESGNVITAKAKAALLKDTADLDSDAKYTLVLKGTVRDAKNADAGKTFTLVNKGGQTINGSKLPTNEPPIKIVVPKPNKAWTDSHPMANGLEDVKWANNVGIDAHTVYPGDQVGTVVNGYVEADLVYNLSNFQLTEDWTKSKDWVDFTAGTADLRVFRDGKDVTSQFDFSSKGTTTTATAKKEFLETTADLKTRSLVQFSLVDKIRKEASELESGKDYILPNNGSFTYNKSKLDTNEPELNLRVPELTKSVVGALRQDGYYEDINGQKVLKNQWVKYLLDSEYSMAKNAVYDKLDTYTIVDTYSEYTEADKASLIVYDTRTNKVIPATQYTTKWDTAKHVLTVDMGKQWRDTVKPGIAGHLQITFDAQVTADNPIENTFKLIRNNGEIQANTVHNPPDKEPPVEKQVSTVEHADANEKWFYPGDVFTYTVNFGSASPRAEMAYDAHKLMMVDDFDENVVDIEPSGVHVMDGENEVTDQFDIAVIDGKLYVSAKLVDRTNAAGDEIKGYTPDLVSYAERFVFDGLNDATINQDLLGKTFAVVIDSKVKTTVGDGTTFNNQASALFEHWAIESNVVTNHVKDPSPEKDVVQVIRGIGQDKSIHGKEVAYQDDFYYVLKSSLFEAGYGHGLNHWSMDDDFDETHDALNGELTVLDAQGNDITASFTFTAFTADGTAIGFTPVNPKTGTASNDALRETLKNAGKLHLEITDTALLDKAYAEGLQYAAYVGFDRIDKPCESENVFTETINDRTKKSEIVGTTTPDPTPVKDVVLEVGGDSHDTGEIAVGGKAWYKQSTGRQIIAAGSPVESWATRDDFDQSKDQLTGTFKVLAEADLGDIHVGDDITKYFTYSFTDVNGKPVEDPAKANIYYITANKELLDKVNAVMEAEDTASFAWASYAEFTRTAPADKVTNTFTEIFNGEEKESNEVWTHTPTPPADPPATPGNPAAAASRAASSLAHTGAPIAGLGLGMVLTGAGIGLARTGRRQA